MPTEPRLTSIRANAPEKRPTVRVLAAATEHNDCAFAQLALATRTNLDVLLDGTYFAVDFGQDPQAFQRGQTFERLVKDKDYAALIKLLRENAGFALTDVRIRNLRAGAPPNESGMKLRAAETKQLLRKIVRQTNDAPNIVDGAVLTCTIAGQTAYFEADGLAAATNGKLHVAEIKSFPITDGRCDHDKYGAACDQAAWYAMLCRLTLIELGLPPDAVSDEGFIILPQGLGLMPTLLREDLSARIRRAETLLDSTPECDDIIKSATTVQFPDVSTAADERLHQIEQIMDTLGTKYRPACLQDCGMSRLCRARTQGTGLVDVAGSSIVRALPGVRTWKRAAELARGARPNHTEAHVAAELKRANAVYERVLKEGRL